MPESEIAGVVLAAGESRRFGGRKQLAPLGGRTLLEHVLAAGRAAGLRPVVAVVPVWLTRPAGFDAGVAWLRNPFPERGMSYSLQLGLAAVPPAAGAAIVLLGDQPTVGVAQLAALVAARGERPMVASGARGVLAPPLLIERSHFGVVETLGGDIGLREILSQHPEWVTTVEVERHAADVDTPADLARLRQGR